MRLCSIWFNLLSACFLLGGSILSGAIFTPYCPEIEAIIFDCDGVLVDTEYLKFLAWKEALACENVDFTIEEYRPLVGHSSVNILLAIQKIKGRDIPREVIEVKNRKYKILQSQGVSPIPQMIAFAKRMIEMKARLGIKLGLASSAPQLEILENLKQIGLETSFDLIISGSDDLADYVDKEGKNKPKPYIYMEAAKRLNVAASKCLVFEDTAAGVESAAGAGMVVVAVPNRFTVEQDFSKAVEVVTSYTELPEIECGKAPLP